MRVKDLILLLKDEDENKRIIVDGYEGGFDELRKLEHVCITPNPDKQKNPKDLWYLGDFEECIYADGEEIAILLPRSS